jgi:hypothetical protein
VHAIDYRLHHVVCGAEGQLAGKPQADDSSRRRPDGGLVLRFSARRRAQAPEGTTPREKWMRNLHSTGSPLSRQSVMAGKQLKNSLQERTFTRLHTFRVISAAASWDSPVSGSLRGTGARHSHPPAAPPEGGDYRDRTGAVFYDGRDQLCTAISRLPGRDRDGHDEVGC